MQSDDNAPGGPRDPPSHESLIDEQRHPGRTASDARRIRFAEEELGPAASTVSHETVPIIRMPSHMAVLIDQEGTDAGHEKHDAYSPSEAGPPVQEEKNIDVHDHTKGTQSSSPEVSASASPGRESPPAPSPSCDAGSVEAKEEKNALISSGSNTQHPESISTLEPLEASIPFAVDPKEDSSVSPSSSEAQHEHKEAQASPRPRTAVLKVGGIGLQFNVSDFLRAQEAKTGALPMYMATKQAMGTGRGSRGGTASREQLMLDSFDTGSSFKMSSECIYMDVCVCLCVCVCVYIHTYVHACMHAYTTCIPTYMCT
jgi:hypothetical protein